MYACGCYMHAPFVARQHSSLRGPSSLDERAILSEQQVILCQKCTSKGIGRQGIVLKYSSSLQKESMPLSSYTLTCAAPTLES